MKIDFSTKILGIDKKTPLKGDDGEKDATLGSISCTALLAVFLDEAQRSEPSADIKVKRFRLAEAVYDGGVQDISVEDVAELKKMIGKAFPALIVGRAFDIIDPPTKAKK